MLPPRRKRALAKTKKNIYKTKKRSKKRRKIQKGANPMMMGLGGGGACSIM